MTHSGAPNGARSLPEPTPADTVALSDLLDLPALQTTVDELHATTGIPFSLIDTDGGIVVGAGWQRICTEFHRRKPEALKACVESDTHFSERFEEMCAGGPLNGDTFEVYRCPHGLVDAATPLVIEGRHLANVFTGQFLLEGDEPDRERFREQARRYGFEESGYLAALDEVPVFSEERVAHMLSFLRGFVEMLVASGAAVAQRDASLELLRAAEQRERISAADLRIVNEAACQLSEMHEPETICTLVAETARKLVPEAVAAASAVSRDAEHLSVSHIVGLGERLRAVGRALGMDVNGIRIPVSGFSAEVKGDLSSGRLYRFEGGLHTFLGGVVPKAACAAAQRLLGAEELWGVGCSFRGHLYGALLLPATGGCDVGRHGEALETLVRQAALSMRRCLAEQESAESKARLEEAQQIARVGDWSWEVATDRTYWSDEVYRIFGLEVGEREPNYDLARDHVHPDDVERWESAVRESVERGTPLSIDYRAVRADGATIWVHNETEVELDDDGRVVALIGTVQDVTEARLVEERLEREYRRQVAVDGAIRRLVAAVDAEQVCGIVTSAVGELLPGAYVLGALVEPDADTLRIADVHGFGPATEAVLRLLPGDPWKLRFSVSEMDEGVRELYRKGGLERFDGGLESLATGKLPKSVCTGIEKLLGIREVRSMGFSAEQGNFGGLTLLVPEGVDVDTEAETIETMVRQASLALHRVEARRWLEESEERYRSIFENAVLGVYRSTPEGRFVNVNPALARILGYDAPGQVLEEVQDLATQVYRRPEDRTLLLERLHAQGEVREYEVEFVRRDGSCVWVSVNLRLVHDAQGREFFDGTIEDISGRKAAEAALIESEERFRSYVHGAPDGIFVTDEHGRYLDCNPAACQMTGYSRDELLDMDVAELSSPAMGEAGLERFREMVERGQVHDEILLRRKDGDDVVCQLDAVSLGDGRFIGFCKDVSDRKRAEEEIRAAAERTQRTLEGTVAAMGALIETRDPYTAGHERRVTELAGAIAGRLGMDDERVGALRMAGEVHDVGKISIPAEILSKPGRLTDNEYDLVRQHPRTGYGILSAVDFRWPVAEIVLQHHERIDGSGYPQGLEGEAIVPEALVLAVADVVEAMSSHRPYRPALGLAAALDEIEQGRGRLYDADVVDACVALFREDGFTFSG